MPRKKTVPIPEDQELTEQTGVVADAGGMEAEAAPESGPAEFPTGDDPFSGGDAGVWEENGWDVPPDDVDGDGAPAGQETGAAEDGGENPDAVFSGGGVDGDAGELPAEDAHPDDGDIPQDDPPPDGETEATDPEYDALLHEWGEANAPPGDEGETVDDPLTLAPPPGEEPDAPAPEDVPAEEMQPRAARPRRRREAPATPPAASRRMADRERVLTIEARDEVQTEAEREAIIWHEIQNADWTHRILTGTLDGVEQTESGLTLAVVNYKGFRVAIPLKEMMLHSGKLPNGQEYLEEMARLRRILMVRLGSEIDFVVKGHDNKSRSAVGSRKDAMLRKRQSFYLDKNELGEPMIYEGRVVQARVVAVSEKIIRVEVFGVECAIVARGLSRAWMGDATEKYSVGDRILVRVLKISGTTVEDLSITADVRSVSSGTNQDNLKKCVVQGRYAGRVTDIRGGVVFIRLNNGVNAIAHSCYDRRTPGKRDDVSFSVTRLDPEQGVAVGIITRIIKQNL